MKGEDGFGFGEERELSPSSITDPLCDSGQSPVITGLVPSPVQWG